MEEYFRHLFMKEIEYRIGMLKAGQCENEKLYAVTVAEIRLLEELIGELDKFINDLGEDE